MLVSLILKYVPIIFLFLKLYILYDKYFINKIKYINELKPLKYLKLLKELKPIKLSNNFTNHFNNNSIFTKLILLFIR